MLIVGYCFGIRSERRLCDEVQSNLGYRWFCRLGLSVLFRLQHSTFSKNRHGRSPATVVPSAGCSTKYWRGCMDAGLVKGEGFAVDASVVEGFRCQWTAQRSWRDQVDWNDERPCTVELSVQYLAALDESRAPPKSVSLTDPQASWTCAPGGPAFFAYSTNYLIDVSTASSSVSTRRRPIACRRLNRRSA